MGRQWCFRSSWECSLARWLDARRRHWDYELRAFEVNVLGKIRTYTPDFWLYDDVGALTCLIDVKGRSWPAQEVVIAAFRAQYPSLRLEVWGPGSAFVRTYALR
jgi:hypothetical protein